MSRRTRRRSIAARLLARPSIEAEEPPVLYMVIEHYTSGPGPIYERAARLGRLLPDGLRFVDSWIDAGPPMDRCFQLMETDDPSLFDVWLERWRDLGTFEVVPVITSTEAAERAGRRWSGDAGGGPR